MLKNNKDRNTPYQWEQVYEIAFDKDTEFCSNSSSFEDFCIFDQDLQDYILALTFYIY